MSVEWIAGFLIAFSAIALAGAAWLFFYREPWFLQWLRGTAGVLLVCASGYTVLVAASLFGYAEIRDGVPLATISFKSSGPQTWDATISESSGETRVYKLSGDLWQLDVRMLRYSGITGIFGSAPSYELERLSTRYLSVEDQEEQQKSDYVLVGDLFLGFDIWQRALHNGSFFVTANRSTVSLLPMTDGAMYDIVLADTGFLAVRATNSIAEDALKAVSGK